MVKQLLPESRIGKTCATVAGLGRLSDDVDDQLDNSFKRGNKSGMRNRPDLSMIL